MNRRKYGIPIKIAAHPGLRDYIIHSLGDLRFLLEQVYISKFNAVVLNSPIFRIKSQKLALQ